MIEGVHASIASASLLRASSEQVTAARAYAANPTQVQQLPQAPYVSPYIAMNYEADKAVLQLRDSESGEVVQQIPSENQLRAYRRAAAEQPLLFAQKAERAAARAETVKPVVDAERARAASGADSSAVAVSAATDSGAAPAPVAAPVVVDTSA